MAAAVKGECLICGKSYTKGVMAKHLGKCISEEREASSAGRKLTVPMFRIRVEAKYLPNYWLYIEMPASQVLGTLDNFLRDIWLECCGHMSCFTIAGKRYISHPSEWDDDLDMEVDAGVVLAPGLKFDYVYDFGSSTLLKLQVLDAYENYYGREPVRLLARNEPPPIACVECDQPATAVCGQCYYEDAGWLCDGCAETHGCGEAMLLPVVNSPRVGVCGYTGRAWE